MKDARPGWYIATRHRKLLEGMDALTRRRMAAEQRRHETAIDRLGDDDAAASLQEFDGHKNAVEAIMFQMQDAGR